MANPLVSIAIATYNGESFLEAQLESIFNQDYHLIEVIVVDDCSTDQTLEILEKYALLGKLNLFKNYTNLGYVRNFERAIGLCSGEFVALSDQDDVWEANKISTLVKGIGNNLLIHSDAILIDDNSKKIADSYRVFARKMVYPKSITEMLLNGCVTGCTALISRSLIEAALPFPDGIHIHDKWLGIIAYLNGGLDYLQKPLVKYRQHSKNSIGVSRHKSPFVQKFKRLFLKGKVKINYLPFRNFLIKEYTMVIRLLERNALSDSDRIAVEELKFFYYCVLTGENLGFMLRYFIRYFSAFESNKPIYQKLYFFYMIGNAFYYSRKIGCTAKNELQLVEPRQ